MTAILVVRCGPTGPLSFDPIRRTDRSYMADPIRGIVAEAPRHSADDESRSMDIHTNQHLPPGTSVEVFSAFSASWVSGFEVATIQEDSCELRRQSDQAVLPATFRVDDVRVDRR